jgi:hypothetical protein
MSAPRKTERNRRRNLASWVLVGLTAFIAVGAAYSSYKHGVEFALRYGGDPGTAWIWPLIVDGMLTAGTVVLWTTRHAGKGRGRWAAWVTFGLGIALSLSANITAAPELSLFAVMVTGCPPMALLALIELLNHVLTHHYTETTNGKINEAGPRTNETDVLPATRLSAVSGDSRPHPEPTAEQKMWAYYVTERSKGRAPTGAELDRVFSTNNYGRGVLRRWRDDGRIPAAREARHHGHAVPLGDDMPLRRTG